MKRSCFYYTIISSLFVLLNSVSLQDLFAQTQFRDVTNQPVLSYGSAGEWDDGAVWFPSVIKDGDTLRMWYTGSDNTVWQDPLYRIGYAWSLDGINWNKFIGNPVLGSEFSWEGPNLQFCTVIKDIDTFKIWYATGSNSGIGYATSYDGINWSKNPDPVLEVGSSSEWDDNTIVPHTVIKQDDVYNMWYWAARPGFPYAESLPQIGMATSPDGIHWTKYDDPITTEAPFAESDPVLKVGSTSDWDAIRVINPIVLSTESGYEMWYSGLKAPITTSTKFEIGYATSADGIQWTKSPENPVIPDYSFSWGKAIYGGSILKYDGDYHFWFACFHTPPTQARPQIGYAKTYTRDPYLLVDESKPVLDATDTVVAEIVLDGTIYIVPKGTTLVADSIIKYMVASGETLANTEVHFLLTDFSVGQYVVVAVSNGEFVSPNPVMLKVVPDATLPVLTLVEDTVRGNTVRVSSSKDGILYLLKTAIPPDLSLVRNPNYLIDSIAASATVPVEFSTSGLIKNISYWIYAVDIYGQFSERGTVRVEQGVDVEENANAGIQIYPNPTNDLLTIESGIIGQHSIQIKTLNSQLILSMKMNGSSHQIDFSSFRSGVYIITIRSKDLITTRKIIKL